MATKGEFPFGELNRIVQEYRHLRGERAGEGQEGSWRRRLGAQARALEEQYERLLECWVADPASQEAWRAHLHRGAEVPSQPEPSSPPCFVGYSAVGTRIEVVPAEGGGYEVRLDGQPAGHIANPPSLISSDNKTSMQLDRQRFVEDFNTAMEAVNALRALASTRQQPPARWALELLRSGLIDQHFGITERGRRLLAQG